MEVLQMWHQLQRIRRDQAALAELPVAQLVALTANINRDSKKQPKPFVTPDFCLFRREEPDAQQMSAAVAAVALDLRHEDRCPPLLLAAWPQVLAAVKDGTRTPELRALHSDDEAVWILAPQWEGANCRGGLVVVRGQISGTITVRDLDRPLMVHRLVLPQRPGFGWLEAGLLLLGENYNHEPAEPPY